MNVCLLFTVQRISINTIRFNPKLPHIRLKRKTSLIFGMDKIGDEPVINNSFKYLVRARMFACVVIQFLICIRFFCMSKQIFQWVAQLSYLAPHMLIYKKNSGKTMRAHSSCGRTRIFTYMN